MTEICYNIKKNTCDNCGAKSNEMALHVDLSHLREIDLIEKEFGKVVFYSCYSCYLKAQGFKAIK